MRNLDKYRLKGFPASRIAKADIGVVGQGKHHIRALIELDVTEARFLRRMVWKKIIRSPFLTKRNMGTVIITSVGMMEYLYLTAAVDHDVIDGAPAVRALSRLADMVERAAGL
ncbi:MAG TPA: hypothetical protein PKA19_15650 [Bacillota bacterium]|nr:hypothetical protein [Bacillota bacterium]